VPQLEKLKCGKLTTERKIQVCIGSFSFQILALRVSRSDQRRRFFDRSICAM
jgi:hypothetical protein